MQSRQYFGTDGVRGKVGDVPMTPDWVMHLAWAVGKMLSDNGYAGEKVIIGKDTRLSGYMFENAIVSGLTAAGMDAHLLGVMPTPGIAYFTRTFHAAAGIVVSASHNPYYDNGVKVFAPGGYKLPDEAERTIEAYLEKPMKLVGSAELGKAYRVPEARGRYIEFCKNAVPLNLPFQRLKIVLDCANGATYAIAPDVFRELGANVTVINADPNGCNINAGAGSTHPESLQRRVREEQADVGIAFDGDGDRVIMVDRNGRLLDGDAILYIIAKYRAFKGEKLHTVVGTLMTNLGLEHALEAMGIRLHRTQVGDRYVLEKLQALNARVGGENSGHIICLDRNSTGDGIIAALQVLAAVLEMGESVESLTQDLHMTTQILKNITVHEKNIVNGSAVQNALEAAEKKLGNNGRLLLRPSGTEPKIRVMAEGDDEALLNEIVDELVTVIKQETHNA
ncbi:phosphoglucosamine mutase [Suttonella ornithocola]|uniref:Phosphoglucosamine mutase n=1 Tax=Suttonella ornithocola TaxID=279832 RepID=A0A380MPH9_9GAMM|nr:phosphoglucosamine mutase [Suttonella ornithocola]SUO94520.1 Phosphoglucosamine mutase [Suttonella ornithocola]